MSPLHKSVVQKTILKIRIKKRSEGDKRKGKTILLESDKKEEGAREPTSRLILSTTKTNYEGGLGGQEKKKNFELTEVPELKGRK